MLRVLWDWIPFQWQKAVFWTPLLISGDNFFNNHRKPDDRIAGVPIID
jgi:hypothetical protein